MSVEATRTPTRRTRSNGERSRRAVLAAAPAEATVHGLQGLTIGMLADKVGMSKSSLHALFGSKEELELAIIEQAHLVYDKQIVQPALQESDPLKKLLALCENWLSFVERDIFPGGCFFAAVNAEYDTRPGAVRNQLVLLHSRWTELVSAAVVESQEAGRLSGKQSPQELTFQILAILGQANDMYLLYQDASRIEMGRTIVRRLLGVDVHAG
ncbi:TetR/AcrR family transcriptional regulator [Streptomyces sp. NPDC085937]|uniref:TetR/AcrR family transcriptional regulator n=1 Tax=Streptomyces sp. NPDC085937 TaxID=3365742 RepID=UPI0037D02A50